MSQLSRAIVRIALMCVQSTLGLYHHEWWTCFITRVGRGVADRWGRFTPFFTIGRFTRKTILDHLLSESSNRDTKKTRLTTSSPFTRKEWWTYIVRDISPNPIVKVQGGILSHAVESVSLFPSIGEEIRLKACVCFSCISSPCPG